ncbi:KR domain-containing protein [Hypoxylon sp. NC1633]|nr:KR domain-containing protein [Hypoxylon sp. NC1633]
MPTARSRKVAPAKYLTVLDPDKIYLLVGCLGYLGRSLSRWMLKRGARRFAFIGRSGTDKLSAKALIDHLKNNGADVIVSRGDGSVFEDVQAAVQVLDTGKPIGGVVQAAMGLHETVFSRMSNEAWHTAIQPKWRRTWNPYNALDGHDTTLDFFLLTSSVSGSVATTTESNYCAANGFLDAWAHWGRMQGKKTVSALHKLVDKGWDATIANMVDPRSAVLSASPLAEINRENGGAGEDLANLPAWLTGILPPVAKPLASESEASKLVEAIFRVTLK